MNKFKIGDICIVTNLNESGGSEERIGTQIEITEFTTSGYRGKFNDGAHYLIKDSELKLKINNQTIMSNIKSTFKNLIRKEPQKSFVKSGILDQNEELTSEGTQIFLEWLLEKNATEFNTEVVQKIIKEQEDK